MGETDKDDLIKMIEEDENDTNFPEIMPLMPVRDVVIFTDMLLPLFVGREKSVRAVEEAVRKDGFLLLVTQKDPNVENPGQDEMFRIGTVSKVLRMLKLPDGRVKALVQGIAKAKILNYVRRKSVYRVKIERIIEAPLKDVSLEIQALMRIVRENSEKIMAFRGELTGDVGSILEGINDPGKLADLVASNLRLKIEESQQLLELIDPLKRLKKVNELLSKEVQLSAMQAKIQSDVKEEISKSQRDYYLREQMRAINKELGDNDERSQELTSYRKKIKRCKMPKEAEKEAEKQLKRLEMMYTDSAEASVIRTYIDWLVELPWSKATKDILNIKHAKKVLDKDHYGLDN
ncbi:MAG: endopeptidase La, partial [Desulfobacterium sp.]|nr:endopeptidase La [Desulfobacterium sp.]